MIPIRGRLQGVNEAMSAFSQLPSLLRQAGEAAMRESLELLSNVVRTQFLRGPYPQEVARRTGSFAATFTRGHAENIFEVRSEGDVIHGTFGSKDIRGRVLEEGTGYLPGGVIRPRRGQFLAIPMEDALTPTGRLKSQYAAARTSWRNVPNTFILRSRRGLIGPSPDPSGRSGLFIAERAFAGRARRGQRLRLLARLVRFVKIEGRHYMRKTQTVVEPMLGPLWERRLQEPLKRLQAVINRFRGAA